jgi:hypothetical protein
MQSGPATLFLDFCFFVRGVLATLLTELPQLQLLPHIAVLFGCIVDSAAFAAL